MSEAVRKLKHAEIKPLREELLKKQGGCCAICTKKIRPDEAVLDHCHRTGHIRDVLCRNCNGIEGKIFNLATRAKRQWTERAILDRFKGYWEKHERTTHFGLTDLHPTHKTDEEKRVRKNALARARRAANK